MFQSFYSVDSDISCIRKMQLNAKSSFRQMDSFGIQIGLIPYGFVGHFNYMNIGIDKMLLPNQFRILKHNASIHHIRFLNWNLLSIYPLHTCSFLYPLHVISFNLMPRINDCVERERTRTHARTATAVIFIRNSNLTAFMIHTRARSLPVRLPQMQRQLSI